MKHLVCLWRFYIMLFIQTKKPCKILQGFFVFGLLREKPTYHSKSLAYSLCHP